MRTTRRAALVGGLSLISAPACAASRPGLRVLAARGRLTYGAALEPQSVENDPAFARLVHDQCGLIAAENALKWLALRPSADRFDFGPADRVAAIARAQGAPLHGHCLVWHVAMPDWLTRSLSSRNAEGLLTTHIATVVRRYAGTAASWDVVNEAVERNDRRPDGLRVSPWLKALGPGYLDLAFHAAHAADPAARLALNDYGLEYDDETWRVEKRGTLLALLRDLVRRRVPIHALGVQAHLIGHRPPAYGQAFADFLAEVADLGLEIHISELDVDDQKVVGSAEARDGMVGEHYARFLDVALAQRAVTRVVTWGLSDRYTSKAFLSPRPDGSPVRPLPFDADLKPKPAAAALVAAFARRA